MSVGDICQFWSERGAALMPSLATPSGIGPDSVATARVQAKVTSGGTARLARPLPSVSLAPPVAGTPRADSPWWTSGGVEIYSSIAALLARSEPPADFAFRSLSRSQSSETAAYYLPRARASDRCKSCAVIGPTSLVSNRNLLPNFAFHHFHAPQCIRSRTRTSDTRRCRSR